MPKVEIAHVSQHGQQMIIVPLDDAFEFKSTSAQSALFQEIKNAASSADLTGEVVIIWQAGGRIKFLAPRAWHGFVKNITLQWALSNINQTLSW